MVEEQRQQVSDLQFDKLPNPSHFLCWEDEIPKLSAYMFWFSSEAMYLIEEVEKATSIDVLKTSRSISGEKYPNCEMLDARDATGLRKLISNSHFKRTVNLEDRKAQKEDRFLRGEKLLSWSMNTFGWQVLTRPYWTSRRKLLILEEKQVRQQEELVMKEKALRTIRFEVCTRWEKWRELKNCESTNSLCKNWEKVMRQYKGSLHKCRKCKKRWILLMIQDNFKKWNRITVGDCLTFPVNQQRSQVLVLCWAATNACHLTHGIRLDYRKTFLVINFYIWFVPKS